MKPFPEYVMQLREEVRVLRLDKDRLTRAHLAQKTKAERLEKRLQDQAKRLKDLQHENERLKEELDQSSKTKKRSQVALFDHGNFRHRADQTKKNKGGQAGHKDTNREAQHDQPALEKQRLFAPVCGHCGEALARVNATRHKVLLDIVLHPQVVKRLLLQISHGLTLSPSVICNLLAQAKKYLQGHYEQLIAAVRAGAVMYNDETGWLVNGQKAWMWLMANEEVTVYFAAESRGGGIARELYGKSHALSMHDGYASYTNALPQEKHLYCWAHVLRFAHEETVLEPEGSPAKGLTQQLVKVYHLKDQPESSGSTDRQAQLRAELDTLLAVASTSPCIQTIQARLRVQKDGLIRSLLCTPDGTNNLAERELRTMVINRHISNGSNTFTGMQTSAVLASLVQTAAKKGTQTLPSFQRALQEGIQEQVTHYLHPVCVDSS